MEKVTRKKKLRELEFGRVTMEAPSCPGCGQAVEVVGVDMCFKCGFHLKAMDQLFPFPPLDLDEIIDVSQILNASERAAFEKIFRVISRKYPQFRFSLALMDLDPRMNPALFAYWFLNRSTTVRGKSTLGQKSTVLIVFDTANQRLGISKGYAVEAYLSKEALRDILEPVLEKLSIPDYLEAAKLLEEGFLTNLKKSKQRMKRKGLK